MDNASEIEAMHIKNCYNMLLLMVSAVKNRKNKNDYNVNKDDVNGDYYGGSDDDDTVNLYDLFTMIL